MKLSSAGVKAGEAKRKANRAHPTTHQLTEGCEPFAGCAAGCHVRFSLSPSTKGSAEPHGDLRGLPSCLRNSGSGGAWRFPASEGRRQRLCSLPKQHQASCCGCSPLKVGQILLQPRFGSFSERWMEQTPAQGCSVRVGHADRLLPRVVFVPGPG